MQTHGSSSAALPTDSPEPAGHGHHHHAAPAGHGLPPPDQPVYMGLPHERYLRPRLYVAVALTLPVLFLAMGEMIVPDLVHHLSTRMTGWIQWLLATPIFFWSGAPLNRRWWKSIVTRDTNMFTLTVTGTGAAYLYSVAAILLWNHFPAEYQTRHGVPVYFEAVAFITTIVLLGQILEQRAHARTDAAIRALMKLAPATAHRLRADGVEEDVPVDSVHPGDRLRVRPGENLPVDGTLLDGAAEIDEAMLTGEPLPVTKAAGDRLSAGTLNTTGSFVFRAERVGANTLLAQIIRLVEEAVESDAPIARLADRVANWFVPAVLAVAAVTFLGWGLFASDRGWLYGLINGVSVLIIACPCAFGLATPVSLVTGIGRGASAGILVKNAAALERLAGANTLLIDKTGTLTEGHPRVVGTEPTTDFSADELLRLAASAESASEHPLARAIVAAAQARGLALAVARDFHAEAGVGVTARVDGRQIQVGRVDPNMATRVEVSALHPSATLVAVRVEGRPAGVIALADAVKATTPAAIRELQRLGLRVVMASGDNEAAARAVADELALDGCHAAVTPARKQELVREHQARGERVVFAGDGLNDAPALAAAEVGIAMGTGTDVAMHSAGLVLVKGDLAALVRAVHLSRAVLRNIKENIFWAFAFNTAGIPVAAGALFAFTGWLLNPMYASVAMSLSSITVVSNALRLRRAVL
ncbi:MAG TPA: copper-translocating P-type ATPase [Lacunisphaera sp.]|nr:copper-translocating P-type ATPase [Lacunisphaera sp.]